jgi:hypothetical protein
MNIVISDTTVYSNELLNTAIKEYRDSFESKKMNQLTELSLDADINPIEKLTKMSEIAKQTIENIQPINLGYFDGKLYELPLKVTKSGSITSRVKGGGKFQIGQQVRMISGDFQSEVYTVADNNKVLDADKVPYSPSVLTKKFHCETLGIPDNGWDMAGLSHNYWHAV